MRSKRSCGWSTGSTQQPRSPPRLAGHEDVDAAVAFARQKERTAVDRECRGKVERRAVPELHLKSGKPREIPLGDEVKAALKAHRHLRGALVFCDLASSRDLPYRFITRLLRLATSRAMYSFISSSEKHVMLRRRARIQRWAISIPPSTFALSRGLIGRAGKIVVE